MPLQAMPGRRVFAVAGLGLQAANMIGALLRCLIVEDSEDDALLLYSELARINRKVQYLRVDCAEDMRAALLEADWDLVISDHSLPRFSSLEALKVLQESGRDIPFIIYSGEVSEHVAVAAMHSGAQDAIPKGNFARLLPSIEREMRGAVLRRAKKKADEDVRKLAFYDSLTGLPNRNLFCDFVARHRTQTADRAATVFVLDIDHFLRINHCYGPRVGDELICQFAQRLQECVPDDGMVARLCSDEFAVFLATESSDQAREIAEHMGRSLSKTFTQGPLEFHLSISIGIVVSTSDADEIADLLINAEMAMFRAKSMGGNTNQFYASEMGVVARQQLKLENAMRCAVERNELFVEYQPSWDAASGKLIGIEAFVRWRHPELGVLQPDDFIPLANESGVIIEIGRWVLSQACAQTMAWQAAGHPDLTIAVNVSSVQFWQPGLVQTVAEVLAATAIDPQCLELEISESVLLRDVKITIGTLRALKSMKVKISVGHFGTAHSSLSYLKRLPIDILKVDRSMSCDVTQDVETAAIVKAVGALGRSLGLVTVVEGVETMEQFQFFHDQRYDRVQGFLFSKPRSAEDITELLNLRSSAPPPSGRGHAAAV